MSGFNCAALRRCAPNKAFEQTPQYAAVSFIRTGRSSTPRRWAEKRLGGIVRRVLILAIATAALAVSSCGASGTVAPVSTVAARPGLHVWALDPTGTLAATNDGGATWTTQAIVAPTSDVLCRALTFADPRHGWVVGSGGEVFATADGGATWQAQVSGTEAQLRDVSFADASHGWAVGSKGTLLATADGGRSWALRQLEGSLTFNGVVCLGARHILAVGSDVSSGAASIYRSSDGGRHWQLAHRAALTSYWDVAAPDEQHCWVIGQDEDSHKGLILSSEDGGAHWTTQYTSPPLDIDTVSLPFFTSVAFTDATHGWAVGPNDTILATTDGGASWVAQDSGSQGRYRAVACSGPLEAWVVGTQSLNAVVMNTSDGGSTWTLPYDREAVGGFLAVTCQVEE